MDTNNLLAIQIIKMLKQSGLQIEEPITKQNLINILKRYDIEKISTQKRSNIQAMIEPFISVKRIDGLSDQSLKRYKERLTLFGKQINKSVDKITTDDIRGYIAYLADERHLKRSTMATDINIIKSFYNWLLVEEKIKSNPCLKIKNLKIDKKGARKALSVEELEKLRIACKTIRDRTIIEALYSTGCRLSEIVNVSVDDINFTERSISVVGKGNKRRTVYFSVKAKLYMEDYLKNNQRSDNSLFVSTIKPYQRIGVRSLQKILQKIGIDAGINKRVHPHLLRHTFACHALNSGMDINIIQQLLGHEDMSTTQIYAELNQNSVKQAYHKLM